MINIIRLLIVFALFAAQGCMTILEPGERGLIFRPYTSGLDQKTVGSRVQFYFPWNTIYVYDTQWHSYVEQVEVLTRDDLTITVTAALILRPKSEELYQLQNMIGPDFYDRVVRQQFRTSIRNVLSQYNMINISKETPNVSKALKEQLTAKLQDKHIEIDDVIIDDINYSKAILAAIEAKLTRQQEQEQMRFEINIAKKDAEITTIQAEANAKATLMQAEAQAKAQRVISESLTGRYIQLKALENPNSKLVIVPAGKDGLPIIVNAESANSKSDSGAESGSRGKSEK